MFMSCKEERIAIDEASKSAGRVDVMTMVFADSSFISTEKLHENEPSKNGEHQKIENVSWSLAGR